LGRAKRLKIDIKKVIGTLIGLTILVEGSILAISAKPAIIQGIGGIQSSTVLLAGIQLALLGAFIMLAWPLKDLKLLKDRTELHKIFTFLILILNLVVLVEGLFLTLYANKVIFTGGRTFGHVAAALLSAQLLSLGLMSTILWFKRDAKEINLLAWFAGIVASTGIVASGAMIIGCASALTAGNISDVGPGKMTVAGSVLLALGAICLFVWLFNGKLGQWKGGRVPFILICISTAVIGLAAIYLSGVATDMRLGNFFRATKLQVVLVASGLFLLAAVSFVAWFIRTEQMRLRFLPELIGLVCGLILATEGVIVFGLADKATIVGYGILPASVTLIIGYQMILLGGVVVMAWLLQVTNYFNKGFRKTLLDLFMVLITSIVVIDGISALVISGQTQLVGVGTLTHRTIVLFGLQLGVLGLVSSLTWVFRENPATPRLRRFQFLAFLFMALLLIAAMVI
jgi:hypothetical protein